MFSDSRTSAEAKASKVMMIDRLTVFVGVKGLRDVQQNYFVVRTMNGGQIPCT
jgi:hypothetical protein